jgi:hypothetical protein
MSDQYFGPYRGTVTDNDDPSGRMRIRVRVPDVLGELDAWALPCVPPGVESVPEVGTVVWIEFEAGDSEHPVWMGTLGVGDSRHQTR